MLEIEIFLLELSLRHRVHLILTVLLMGPSANRVHWIFLATFFWVNVMEPRIKPKGCCTSRHQVSGHLGSVLLLAVCWWRYTESGLLEHDQVRFHSCQPFLMVVHGSQRGARRILQESPLHGLPSSLSSLLLFLVVVQHGMGLKFSAIRSEAAPRSAAA